MKPSQFTYAGSPASPFQSHVLMQTAQHSYPASMPGAPQSIQPSLSMGLGGGSGDNFANSYHENMQRMTIGQPPSASVQAGSWASTIVHDQFCEQTD
jgi:hypothetical protein